MLLAQLPRPARFRPHEAALNNANQSRSAETALSFITEASRDRPGDRERESQPDNNSDKTRKWNVSRIDESQNPQIMRIAVISEACWVIYE